MVIATGSFIIWITHARRYLGSDAQFISMV